MDERQTWKILQSNLPALVQNMLTLGPNESIAVYCDPSGRNLTFGKPDDAMNVKLCQLSPPNLEDSYDIHPKGNGYVTGDGDEISKEDFPDYLAQTIKGIIDGGGEWGWEFKLS